MSAGSGVRHSEFNASASEPVHFLQIWIIPDVVGIAPSYEEKHFTSQDRRGRLCLVASPNQAEGSVLMHQDARIFAGLFDGAEHASFTIGDGRQCYVHLARGALHVAGLHLEAGDGLKVTDAGEIEIREGKGRGSIGVRLAGTDTPVAKSPRPLLRREDAGEAARLLRWPHEIRE